MAGEEVKSESGHVTWPGHQQDYLDAFFNPATFKVAALLMIKPHLSMATKYSIKCSNKTKKNKTKFLFKIIT